MNHRPNSNANLSRPFPNKHKPFILKYLSVISLSVWGGLMAGGWLGYLLFLLGWPGSHWLALAYNNLLPITVILILGGVVIIPVIGLALLLLLLLRLKHEWQQRANSSIRKLLVIALSWLMAILALLPNFILQYQPYHDQAIAPWHVVYRVIYVSPLDNNYGDLMLLQCRWGGVCRQVYRGETNISSAEEALIAYNPNTDQVALHIEGQWVYVRSPGAPSCRTTLRSLADYGKCQFTPIG